MITKRAAVRVTIAAKIRCWRSLDAPLAVEEIKSLFGLPPRYVVTRRLANGNQEIISRHRTRDAAIATLQKLEASA